MAGRSIVAALAWRPEIGSRSVASEPGKAWRASPRGLCSPADQAGVARRVDRSEDGLPVHRPRSWFVPTGNISDLYVGDERKTVFEGRDGIVPGFRAMVDIVASQDDPTQSG
jgi:hypothetical protein